jgi:2-aminoadipate transaminase
MDEEGCARSARGRRSWSGPKPAFLYTIPTFQNPSGRTLSTREARRIVELVRAHDLLVLEDDPYGLVRFEGEPQPSLLALERGERVVYASSFSKTVAPGSAVGYFVLPSPLRAELEAALDIHLHHARPARTGDRLRVHPPRQLRLEPGTGA